MKKIILDHFRRWWWVLAACLIAYFAVQATYVHKENSQSSDDPTTASVQHMINGIHYTFIFQAVMWLGFLLVWDFQRGLPRVLTSLPVTTKQIGRAWWLASVAFPAITLGIVGLLAVLIFSGGANIPILLENYLRNWSLAALYLGAAFGALTFMTTTMPDTFIERIRTIPSNLLFTLTIFGVIFLQLGTLTQTQTQLIFAAYIILSVLGWFRAEALVRKRTTARLITAPAKRQPNERACSEGHGGLRFLFETIFIRQIMIGLFMAGAFCLFYGFISWRQPVSSHHSNDPLFVIWQFWWIMMFQIIIVSTHLRFLRTMPFSAWKLSAVIVFAPFLAMLAVTFLITFSLSAIAGFAAVSPMEMFRQGYFLQISLATTLAPLIIWRGYDIAVTTWRTHDILIFLLLIVGMIACILGYGFMKNHLFISGTVSPLAILGSFFVTKLMLERSSRTYRPSAIQLSSWGWRR
jgi:hypothetical protein